MYDMGDLIVEYQNAKTATDDAKDAVKRYDQASRDRKHFRFAGTRRILANLH